MALGGGKKNILLFQRQQLYYQKFLMFFNLSWSISVNFLECLTGLKKGAAKCNYNQFFKKWWQFIERWRRWEIIFCCLILVLFSFFVVFFFKWGMKIFQIFYLFIIRNSKIARKSLGHVIFFFFERRRLYAHQILNTFARFHFTFKVIQFNR